MPDQQEEKLTRFAGSRPPRERVFYANAIDFALSEDQEAVLDFKLVMPEDIQLAQELVAEDDETKTIRAAGGVDLRTVPVEVRVYMPVNQFQTMCKRLGLFWTKTKEAKERISQERREEAAESGEA